MKLLKIFVVITMSAFVLASCGQKTALIAPKNVDKKNANAEAQDAKKQEPGLLLD